MTWNESTTSERKTTELYVYFEQRRRRDTVISVLVPCSKEEDIPTIARLRKEEEDSEAQSEEEERPSKKQKKTTGKKREKRIADTRPKGPKQQMDCFVRERVDTAANCVVLVRNMAMPYCRTDEYADERAGRLAVNPEESESESVFGERTWPFVSFGLSCLFGQKPNAKGGDAASLHKKKPVLHIDLGSEEVRDRVMELWEKGLEFQFHSNHQSFSDSIFAHDSSTDKKPITLKAKSKGRKSASDQERR